MIRFSTFPRTEPPPALSNKIVEIFRAHTGQISTEILTKGLISDEVLSILREDLLCLGFKVEGSKKKADKIKRPVYFGENGEPSRQYEIDAYHDEEQCGLEIEAGRSWMGNAIYRDLVQALVMVDLRTLVLCVPLKYRFTSSGKASFSKDYENAVTVAETLYGHSRIKMPYNLVLVGY